MRKDRMESLAQFIERLPADKFDMSDWLEIDWDEVELNHDEIVDKLFCKTDVENMCGTACCIAGWQAIKNNKCLDYDGYVFHKNGGKIGYASDYAEGYLGLNSSESDRLFHWGEWPLEFRQKVHATPKIAAARIRHMIETGE